MIFYKWSEFVSESNKKSLQKKERNKPTLKGSHFLRFKFSVTSPAAFEHRVKPDAGPLATVILSDAVTLQFCQTPY